MALLSLIEAATKRGVSVELLIDFSETCPKSGESEVLKLVDVAGVLHVDEEVLEKFWTYLRSPWPKPKNGARPYIPTSIKNDIKQEANYQCAICGHFNNGEIAHIKAVSDTMDNSPDNLIFLCPNHHSAYDYGFKLASNLTEQEVQETKNLKRNSRRRTMKLEKNATRQLVAVIKFMSDIEKNFQKEGISPALHESYLTEVKHLLRSLPQLIDSASEAAKKDLDIAPPEKILAESAPHLIKIVASSQMDADEKNVRFVVQNITSATEQILIDIDEYDCPHCGGQGFTGLVNDFCKYCKGSCYVSAEKVKKYNRDLIDEVDCPHCHGKGTTGLMGKICSYCKGSCQVSNDEKEDYDPSEIDEVDCPRCNGLGTTGIGGYVCTYCKGDRQVSHKKFVEFPNASIDEVDCPHCEGRGIIGIVGDICGFCKGSCQVTENKKLKYSLANMDEVECPRCAGKGMIGYAGDLCKLCKGKTVVSSAVRKGYKGRRPESG